MPRDQSVLGGGVVDGKKEGDRVEGEKEEYVSELEGHGIWVDETRWIRRIINSCFPARKRSHNRKPPGESLGAAKL